MKIKCYLEIDKSVSPDANLVVIEGQGVKGKFKFTSYPEYWRNGDTVNIDLEEQGVLTEDEVIVELPSVGLTEQELFLVLNNPRGTAMPDDENLVDFVLTNTEILSEVTKDENGAVTIPLEKAQELIDSATQTFTTEVVSNSEVSPARKPRKKKSEQ